MSAQPSPGGTSPGSAAAAAAAAGGGGNRFRPNEGDWVCPDAQCANVNFARRFTCNRCGKEKSTTPPKKKLGQEIGKAAAEKSRGLFSADDWQCGRCGNVNWARRQQCNMCNAPKFGEVEERTGLGGGYNERENVEYKEHEESDSEYDDFGRRKKKRKAGDPDDDDEKLPNFQLDRKEVVDPKRLKPTIEVNENEEEEEDDDDDEDGDLSKYDLTGWGDDESSKDKPNSNPSLKKAESWSRSEEDDSENSRSNSAKNS